MKRFLYLLLSSVLLFGLVVGCSSGEEGESTSDSEASEESSEGSSKVTLSKQREVLGKAAKDFDNLDGISFKYDFTATIESNEIKSTVSEQANVDLSLSPYKYHEKGSTTVLGTEFPMERYGDESYFYESLEGKWSKIKLEKKFDFVKDLNEYRDFLEKDKKGDWASVTKKGSVYSYDLNIDKSTNDDIKDDVKSKAKEIVKSLPLKEIDPNIDMDKLELRVEKVNVKLEIQDKEPRLKKQTIEFEMLAPVGSNLLKISIKADAEVKGKYEKRIDIPEEATKASEVTL